MSQETEKKYSLYRFLGSNLIKQGKMFLNKATRVNKLSYSSYVISGTILADTGKTPVLYDEKYVTTDIETWKTIIENDWTNKRKYVADTFDCFLPDTSLVVKENGNITLKQIQEIPEYPENMEVLDKNNTWTKINWVKSKTSEKSIAIIKGDGGFLETTEDHKLFSKKEFIEASKLPQNPELESIKDFSFLSENLFDKELAYAFGIFLAEGHSNTSKTKTTNYCWQWHIDMGELDCLERIKPVLEKYTDVEMKIVLYPSHMKGAVRGGCVATKNMYRLKSSGKYGDGKILTEIFRDKFYTKNGDKKIPNEILHSDKNSKNEFINGFLDGDGWEKNKNNFFASSKSRVETNGLMMIAKSIGIDVGVYYDDRNYGNRKTCSSILFNYRTKKYRESDERENRIYIENQDTENIVYDINTESGHLFAGGFLVHNCDNFAGAFSSYCADIYGLNTAGRFTVELTDPKTDVHIGYHRAVIIVDDKLDCYLLESQTDKLVKIVKGVDPVIDNWKYKVNYIDMN